MKDFIITTTESIQGYKVEEVIGEVFGVISHSKNFFSDLGAGFKSMIGGEIRAYSALVEEARKKSVERMKFDAIEKGANAVLAMRFSTESIIPGVGAIVAYGTAVKLVEEDKSNE